MIPLPIIAVGIAGCVAFAAGYALRDTMADADELERQKERTEFLARNMVNRQLAEQALSAVEDKSRTALEKALNAPRKPIPCPVDGDVRDVLLPGLGQRLRHIRESGSDASPILAPVPAADPR